MVGSLCLFPILVYFPNSRVNPFSAPLLQVPELSKWALFLRVCFEGLSPHMTNTAGSSVLHCAKGLASQVFLISVAGRSCSLPSFNRTNDLTEAHNCLLWLRCHKIRSSFFSDVNPFKLLRKTWRVGSSDTGHSCGNRRGGSSKCNNRMLSTVSVRHFWLLPVSCIFPFHKAKPNVKAYLFKTWISPRLHLCTCRQSL